MSLDENLPFMYAKTIISLSCRVICCDLIIQKASDSSIPFGKKLSLFSFFRLS